ncbi:MAG TPA: PilN domain-containing protein [Stellaceae bacterium]|nr:PilN domain-containing protein [Stellaceae bacterium]
MTAAADHEPKHVPTWARQALAWWLGELRATAHDAAELFPWGRSDAITVEAGERYWIVRAKGAVVGQVDCGDTAAAGTALRHLVPAGRRGRSVAVELPPERVLARRVDLPAVSHGDLARLLRFEIARHFPFPAERAHFAHRVLPQRDGGSGRTAVEIVAVARETVAEIRATLAAAGIAAQRIAIAGASGTAALVLDDGAGAPSGTWHRALAVALAALTLAAIASPIVRDRVRLAAVEREIAAVAQPARAAAAARQSERSAAALIAGPLRLAASRPPLVAVLDRVTSAVPDGAWLQSLAISGNEITIDGLAPSAAAVALLIEKSGAFTKVTFRAPIARDPVSGLEHFALSATIAEAAR